MSQQISKTQSPSPSQDSRFGIYSNGFYKASFDTYEEAENHVEKWKLWRYGQIEINDKEMWK